MRLKHYCYLVSFCMLLGIMLWGCKKDLNINAPQSVQSAIHQNGIVLHTQSLSDISKNARTADVGYVEKILEEYKYLEIDTDSAKVLDVDGEVSYTFKILKKQDSTFQNLTISNKAVVLYTYYPEATWNDSLKQRKTLPLLGKVKTQVLESVGTDARRAEMQCVYFTVYETSIRPCLGGERHLPGQGCTHEGQRDGPQIIVTPKIVSDCFAVDLGIGVESGRATMGSNSNNNNIQNTTPYIEDDTKGLIRLPIRPSPSKAVVLMDDEALDFIASDPRGKMLNVYLQSGNDAPSDIAFVNWLVSFLNENKDVTTEQLDNWFIKANNDEKGVFLSNYTQQDFVISDALISKANAIVDKHFDPNQNRKNIWSILNNEMLQFLSTSYGRELFRNTKAGHLQSFQLTIEAIWQENCYLTFSDVKHQKYDSYKRRIAAAASLAEKAQIIAERSGYVRSELLKLQLVFDGLHAWFVGMVSFSNPKILPSFKSKVSDFRIVRNATKGGLKYSDDLVRAAQKLYPKLAGKTQLHHITPKYLGGAANGPLVPLDAAYHQQITNAFRQAWPYSQGAIKDPAVLKSVMDKVYKQFPLPPGYGY